MYLLYVYININIYIYIYWGICLVTNQHTSRRKLKGWMTKKNFEVGTQTPITISQQKWLPECWALVWTWTPCHLIFGRCWTELFGMISTHGTSHIQAAVVFKLCLDRKAYAVKAFMPEFNPRIRSSSPKRWAGQSVTHRKSQVPQRAIALMLQNLPWQTHGGGHLNIFRNARSK